jgi:hypothetical protein
MCKNFFWGDGVEIFRETEGKNTQERGEKHTGKGIKTHGEREKNT